MLVVLASLALHGCGKSLDVSPAALGPVSVDPVVDAPEEPAIPGTLMGGGWDTLGMTASTFGVAGAAVAAAALEIASEAPENAFAQVMRDHDIRPGALFRENFERTLCRAGIFTLVEPGEAPNLFVLSVENLKLRLYGGRLARLTMKVNGRLLAADGRELWKQTVDTNDRESPPFEVRHFIEQPELMHASIDCALGRASAELVQSLTDESLKLGIPPGCLNFPSPDLWSDEASSGGDEELGER